MNNILSKNKNDNRAVWHLAIAYDGTHFHGYQVQTQQRTVQDELEKRLRVFFHQPELRIFGTSRTDAGVHALDQQVSFRLQRDSILSPAEVRQRLNRWLSQDVKVKSVTLQPPDFHARYSVFGKAYTYALYKGEKINPLFSRYVWHLQRKFDSDAMKVAAQFLEGEHDFSSFAANPKREVLSHVRTLHQVEVLPEGDFIFFNIVGNSFLYKMVRSIVGYLVAVGIGKADAYRTPEVLAAKNRSAAAESAPPQGLFLAKAFLSEEEWRSYKPLLPPFAWDTE